MKKINTVFILFVFLIGFMSIIYIWKAEDEKKVLETQISQQTNRIDSLNTQLAESKIEKKQQLFGDVKGATTTPTGTISGLISGENLSENTIVCAKDQRSKQEYCSDELTQLNNEAKYILEIPRGQYSIYSITPPDSTQTFYSDIINCIDEDTDCEEKRIKRLLELSENKVQSDINIYL